MYAGTGIVWSLCTSGPGLSSSWRCFVRDKLSRGLPGRGSGGGGISTTRTVRVPGLYLLTVLTARYRVRVLYEYCTPVRLNASKPQQGEVYNPGPDVRRDRDYLVPVYVGTGIIAIVRAR